MAAKNCRSENRWHAARTDCSTRDEVENQKLRPDQSRRTFRLALGDQVDRREAFEGWTIAASRLEQGGSGLAWREHFPRASNDSKGFRSSWENCWPDNRIARLPDRH